MTPFYYFSLSKTALTDFNAIVSGSFPLHLLNRDGENVRVAKNVPSDIKRERDEWANFFLLLGDTNHKH